MLIPQVFSNTSDCVRVCARARACACMSACRQTCDRACDGAGRGCHIFGCVLGDACGEGEVVGYPSSIFTTHEFLSWEKGVCFISPYFVVSGGQCLSQVGAVVVGHDRNINYYKIQYATLCIRENPGCQFIATNLDAVTHLTGDLPGSFHTALQ
jgi:ribonucleotide monophosphatase NagD (HAD superfamily)